MLYKMIGEKLSVKGEVAKYQCALSGFRLFGRRMGTWIRQYLRVNSLEGGVDDTLAPVSFYAVSASSVDMKRSKWTLSGRRLCGSDKCSSLGTSPVANESLGMIVDWA